MIGQIYLHSINLNDDVVCNNFALPAPFMSSISQTLYGCDPEDLFLHPENCLSGFVSPVARSIFLASFIRKNLTPYNGFGVEILFKEGEKEQLLFKSGLEIEFEKIRSREFPKKPSRLSSIFLVEDNDEGRVCLREMFFNLVNIGYYNPLVLTVKVCDVHSFHKGDIRWLDEYKRTSNQDFIRSYWKGLTFDSCPLFEYFLEGIVVPTNIEHIENLRVHGTFFPESSSKWQELSDVKFKGWFGSTL